MNGVRRLAAIFTILASALAVCGATLDLRSMQLRESVAPRTISQTLQALQELALTSTSTLPMIVIVTPTYTATGEPAATSSPIPTATGSPAPTETATFTSTPAPPTLSVSAATNCYAGPSTKYGLVYTLHPGIVALVLGMDLPDSYWIIAVPGYPATVCWLSSQFALVSGDTTGLPSPATPLPSIYTLDEPKNLSASCTAGPSAVNDDDDGASTWTVVFRWVNTEPNATGVRVFRNSRQIARLGPRASSYTDRFTHYDDHSGVTYRVQAFNASAVSSIVSIHMNSCRQ